MGRAKLDVSGFKALAWRGRRLETKQGRISAIQILMPDHPFCNAQGYVYEHRIVMEEQLGRYLTDDELVHHVDLDPTNNVPENLVVLNGTSEHGRLHLLLQLALVELLEQEDLRNLTEYLVEQIRNNEDWKPAKPAKTKHECKLSKRSKDADVD